MADKSDEIKAIVESYELQMKRYRELLDLLEGKMTPKLEELTKKIDEAFTFKIYNEAKGIARSQEILEQAWDENRIVDVLQYADKCGDLVNKITILNNHYKMNVDSWMNELIIEVEKAKNKKAISKETAQKASEIVEQLKIHDYYTKSHAVIIGINNYQNENVLKNAAVKGE